ncbi:acyltransferase [Bosea caraganae]|uniref:Acyltransferase n=2 Tax=Bosea caraganae TaxID=2763117 RepID=A0A370L707_9HYPH|nr:acyltransferase [Bosea caraganae]RDJ25980.1 acyltransferase [Bosea caraganae]
MVAVHHVQPDAAVLAQRSGAAFTPSYLLPWMAGVDIFFVVSGFIMVHSSEKLFDNRDGPRLFLLRRLARIVPLYWAATTLFLLVALLLPAALNSGAPSLAQIAGSYLFWPTVSTEGLAQPIYSLGWTLNYEMLFYVLFGLALFLPRAAVVPAVTLGLAVIVGANWMAGTLPLPFGFWGQPIVLEFAAGMGLALLRRRGFRLPGEYRWLAAGLGVAILLVAARLPGIMTSWTMFAFHGSAAALLVMAASSGSGQSAPSALVRGLAEVGDASYALYLVHPFAIRGLREVFLRIAPGWPLLFVLVALVAAVIAALVVYRWFERPMTRALRRVLRA